MKFFSRFILLFFFVIPTALGQEGMFVRHGYGWNNGGERDDAYSPLVYAGMGATHYLGLENYRSDDKQKNVLFQFNFAGNRSDYGAHMRSFNAKIVAETFYPAMKLKEFALRLGWTNVNFVVIRDFLSQVNFNGRTDYFTAFGPSSDLSRAFSIGRHQFKLSTAWQWQLIGFRVRSGYATSLPSGFELQDVPFQQRIGETVSLFSPVNSIYTSIQPDLTYFLANNNTLSLMYDHHFTRLSAPHVSAISRGCWSINFNFKLK